MGGVVAAPRSRRALLAGLTGGAAALAAGALGGLRTARAGVDGDVVLGALNSESATTTIINNGTEDALDVSALNGAGVFAQNTSSTRAAVVGFGAGRGVQGIVGGTFEAGPANVGVFGNTSVVSDPTFIGVLGAGADGTGVKGTSSSGIGVLGTSAADLGTGVQGSGAQTETSDSIGVLGDGDTGVLGIGTFGALGSAAAAGIGVYGSVSNAPGVPAVFGKTGVIGQTDTGGTGVVGFTGLTAPTPPPDTGIYGRSNTGGANGRGVTGDSPTGSGVLGLSSGTGVGVRAYNPNSGGLGLRVTGKAAFDRSGKLTISAGHSSLTKTGIGLTSASFILATLQTNVAGLFIQAVVTNPSGSRFTIYLNKAPAVSVAVAWLAVN